MRYIIRNISVACLLLVILNSCEEETTWNFKNSEPVVVVDAIITNEDIVQEIRIHHSYQNLNDTSIPLSGADVVITNGIDRYVFNESTTIAGLYISNSFQIANNINYILIIEYKGHIDSAIAKMAPISPLREYQFEPKDSLIKYLDTGSDLPAMTEVYYNWSSIPDYCTKYGACTSAETYYALDVIDIGKEFAPGKQEILFPVGTTINRKKYSLSKNHQKFVRSLLIETEWRGGLFDVEHGNVPSNFKYGTKGWFGVCQVLADSIVVVQ